MPRLIRHEATGPIEVKPNPEGKSAWVCMCGLSQTLPICDGSHKTCRANEAPDKLYVYDKTRKQIVEEKDDV